MHVDKVGHTETIHEAFARLMAVKTPTVDDLEVLVLLEAAGKSVYAAMARGTPNDSIRHLFARHGQEEIGHAMRVRQVIKLVYGEDFPLPADDANPYSLRADAVYPMTSKEGFEAAASGEAVADDFYDTWAAGIGHEEAAQLLRRNGLEERRQGDRIRQATELL